MLYYLPGCDTNKNHPAAGKKISRRDKKIQKTVVQMTKKLYNNIHSMHARVGDAFK